MWQMHSKGREGKGRGVALARLRGWRKVKKLASVGTRRRRHGKEAARAVACARDERQAQERKSGREGGVGPLSRLSSRPGPASTRIAARRRRINEHPRGG